MVKASVYSDTILVWTHGVLVNFNHLNTSSSLGWQCVLDTMWSHWPLSSSWNFSITAGFEPPSSRMRSWHAKHPATTFPTIVSPRLLPNIVEFKAAVFAYFWWDSGTIFTYSHGWVVNSLTLFRDTGLESWVSLHNKIMESFLLSFSTLN